jgi:hypothetical protein
LGGVNFVVAAKYPGAIHEGNGHVVLFVDERATAEQTDAIVSILSGKLGGMPWEAIAGTVGRFDGPIRKSIEIRPAGTKSTVRIQDAVDLRLTPIKDVVSGQEKNVHITYPDGGFFWNEGAVGKSESMRATFGEFTLEWPGRYAAAAEVNWTNRQ